MSFGQLQCGKLLVIDFWHTKCVRCPAALEKLNEEASDLQGECQFVACAISQGDGNVDIVREVVSDWENILHVFIERDVKEEAKKIFGFTAVPFTVVFDEDGNLLASGDPKTINFKALVQRASSTSTSVTAAPSVAGSLTFDEDF